MRHRKKGKSLGRTKAPRKAMMRNLATSLVLYEKVKTTEAKAKALRPIVERFVTQAADNSLQTRRKMLRFFYDQNAVRKLLEELGPRYKDRPGGYLRITRLGNRKGDAAPVVQIEFV